MAWFKIYFVFLASCTLTPSNADGYKNFTEDSCNSAFGVENRDQIKDEQLSATSYIAYMHFAGKGTFNTVAKYGRLNGPLAWCAHEGKPGYRDDPYIQVDFGQIVNISGLAIQGLETFISSYYVKTYTVKFSLDGSHWFNYASPNNKVWQGSTDGKTINRVFFSKLVHARYLQLHPQSYRYRICLRMEIYGCYILNKTENGTRPSTMSNLQPTTTLAFQPSSLLSTLDQPTTMSISQARTGISMFLQRTTSDIIVLQPSTTLASVQPSSVSTVPVQSTCNVAFGVENRDQIKDEQLSATSYIAYMHFAGKGTFNTEAKYGRLNGPLAWCAHEGKPGYRDDPYIQVDFGQIVNISGLAIQGLETFISSYYVKTYTVKFSLDGSHWFNYASPNNKVWQGSTDGKTINRVFFSKLVRARYLQLHPQSFRIRICLRMEIYGCYILNKTENGTRPSTISNLQPTTTLAFQPSSLLSTLDQPTTMSISQPRTSISMFLQPSTSDIIIVLQPSTTLASVQPSSVSTVPVQSTCNVAFGVENRDQIKDEQLSATSYIAYMHFAGKGTFNTEAKYGRLNGPLAWCAHEGKPGYRDDPYIQADFGQIVNISGLAIQGLETFMSSYYVKTYTVKFSLDGSHWFNYASPNNKVWQGSTDGKTINRVFFSKLVRARYLQLHPRSFRIRICLRMEIYGCFINKTDSTVIKETSKHVFLSTMTPKIASSSMSSMSSEPTLASAGLASGVSKAKTGSKKTLIMFVCIALALLAALFTVVIFLVLKKRKRNELSLSTGSFHLLNPRSSQKKTVDSISYACDDV